MTKPTAVQYGSVAKLFHWLTALLILSAIPLGLLAHNLAEALDLQDAAAVSRVTLLFSLHKTVGITAFFVALLRILWTLSHPKPGLPNGDKWFEAFLAHLVHWALYGALVLVPLSGWVHHAAQTGFAPILWPFGQGLPLVPQSTSVAAVSGLIHEIGTKVLIGAIALHFAGVVKHVVIDRDDTLQRMLPGHGATTVSATQRDGHLPRNLAFGIWGGVLITGMVLGMQGSTEGREASVRAPSHSEWQVTDGSLSLTIQQFGNSVTGRFDKWSADIRFDPKTDIGHVTVDIDIASLTLGGVTEQAKDPAFLDAKGFATARFDADIMQTDTGHVAKGTLLLKGQTVPVALPFDLVIDGTTAKMSGGLILDRRDFGIGADMKNEGKLGFSVKVSVALTAMQQP